MKYTVEMAPGGIIYISSFMNITIYEAVMLVIQMGRFSEVCC